MPTLTQRQEQDIADTDDTGLGLVKEAEEKAAASGSVTKKNAASRQPGSQPAAEDRSGNALHY